MHNNESFSDNVSMIYKKLVTKYDKSTTHLQKYKSIAIKRSKLKHGDRVLIFCVGTGLDILPVIEKIGNTGFIFGVDFSKEMLSVAQSRIDRLGFSNIKLLANDITEFSIQDHLLKPFDVAICMLGFSIIPNFLSALN